MRRAGLGGFWSMSPPSPPGPGSTRSVSFAHDHAAPQPPPHRQPVGISV